MEYLLAAIVVGIFAAFYKNVGDIITLTDFESINGPILHLSKEDMVKNKITIDGVRNKLLSVVFVTSTGKQEVAYFKASSNLMSHTERLQREIIKRSVKRSCKEFKSLSEFKFI